MNFFISPKKEKILPGPRAVSCERRRAGPFAAGTFAPAPALSEQAGRALRRNKGTIMTNSANKAVESLRKGQREQREDEKKAAGKGESELDRALEDTFPASDPVAPQSPTKPGAPKHRS